MAKAKTDPQARRAGETHFDWRSRIARQKADERDRTAPLVSPEAERHGEYRDVTLYEVGEGDAVVRILAKRNQVSSIVDKWFREGGVGFDSGSKTAVDRCIACWEARPTLGKLTATYAPTIPGGVANDEWPVEMRDEVDRFRGWFPAAYWDVFENVVRWGKPAGVAGSELASNQPQAIASAKAIVGLIASYIAMKEGY